MSHSTSSALRACRHRPIAACAAAIVAMASPAIAMGIVVQNCNDVGPGSLRAAISSAASGTTVDLTQLTCSTITLEDAQIVIAQTDLTILGPAGRITLAHDGNYDRVLNHQGGGTLHLTNINVTGGDPYSSSHYVNGGCIYSKGNVYLKNSSVSYCVADTYHQGANGGGVFTLGDLTLLSSTLKGNQAGDSLTYVGEGGGAHVGGNFVSVQSSIRNNAAKGSYSSFHGGVGVYQSSSISGSTISGNSAKVIGGLFISSSSSGATGILDNSTVSENHATYRIGGAYLAVPTTIRNSTIAFNTAAVGKVLSFYDAPGLTMGVYGGTISVDLESTIISNNTYISNGATIEDDFSEQIRGSGNITVSGQHNLVVASFVTFAPNVVTVTSCPLLGPLRDNGGPTQTHALMAHSPAIDVGSNPTTQQYDQRGAPFKRSDGLSINFTDIGAYEVQQEDVVFSAGFDGCLDT